jgi:L-rhamnose mutarotase
MTTTIDELIQLYTSFINSFDGSSCDVFESAESLMDKLFDPSLVFITDDGQRDLQWYKQFAKDFASKQGNMAKVTHIQSTSSGFKVTIKNTIDGVALDLITYNGTCSKDENGQYKITHFEPVESNTKHIKNVGKMIQLVEDCKKEEKVPTLDDSEVSDYPEEEVDPTIIFICKMALLNNKEVDFKYHAQEAMKDVERTEKKEGTESFQIFFSESKDTCHTVERYRDSLAAVKHISNMRKNKHRNAAISTCSKISVLEVYGEASKELKDMLCDEEYLVQYYSV